VIVRPYQDADAPAWDALVDRSHNGTFLHTRRFLGYHGDRFRDRSLLVLDDKGRLLGVLPVAEDPRDPEVFMSHPGITYGGMVHDGSLRGDKMVEALDLARAACARAGARELRYKATPFIYHQVPAADDVYALFRLGAFRYRCDLSATIDLENQPAYNRGRRSNLQHARHMGVTVEASLDHLPAFWPILEANLAARHHVKPVHTLAEIQHLAALFPANIEMVAALHEGRVVAGTVLFKKANIDHAQYMSASEAGFELRALDLVFDTCFRMSRERGVRYFDYGMSNEQEGRVLNEGLYRFKTGFGAGGVAYEFFLLPTRSRQEVAA
jgi:hypothetical protein